MANARQVCDDPTAGPVGILAVAPSDSAVQLPAGISFFRGLHVVADGTISVVTFDGATVNLPAGYYATGIDHALIFTRLLATGTTATVRVLV